MNIQEKSTLQQHRRKLVDGIILDVDFFAALRENKLFTQGHIAMIQAEPKRRDQCHKMLELLEKRGPEAFNKLVWLLKENYYWLAKILEDSLNQRGQGADMQECDQATNRNETALKSPVRIKSTPCKTLTARRNNNANKIPQSETLDFSRNAMADACCSPIHIIESPRKTVHKSCSPIPPVKMEKQTSFNFDEVDAVDSPSAKPSYYTDAQTDTQIETIHQHNMNRLSEKLNSILKENEDVAENDSYTSDEESAASTSSCDSPSPVTFKYINDHVDKLVKRLDSAEATAASVSVCQSLIDSQDRKQPLERGIRQLIQKIKELEIKLIEEKRNSDKMVEDMYIYSIDMKNLDKIQQRLQQAENDKEMHESKLEEMEMLVSDKDKKINALEEQVRELEEWKASQQQEKKIELEEWKASQQQEKKIPRRNVIPPRRPNGQTLSKRATIPAGVPKIRLSLAGDGYQGAYRSPRGGNSQPKWKNRIL